MKKNASPATLKLKRETVRTLERGELARAVGGAATDHCMHPTTTVIRTNDC